MTPPPVAAAYTVEEYLAGFPDDVRAIIEQARHAIRGALPEANERISYGIIRFESAGRHPIYLGGWKNHIGIYPVPKSEGKLERDVATFRAAKDTLHFSYATPLPLKLIGRVAAFAAREQGR